MEFATCKKCGIIFPNPDGQSELCKKCAGAESGPVTSSKDTLRKLKSVLRDSIAKGDYLTMGDLAEASGIEEKEIWHYINIGELDTASLDDPKVRDYLVKKRRKLARQAQQDTGDNESATEENPPEPRHTGFHLKKTDDKGK